MYRQLICCNLKTFRLPRRAKLPMNAAPVRRTTVEEKRPMAMASTINMRLTFEPADSASG